MKKTKWMALLLAAVMTLGSLTGCGGGETTTSEGGSSEGTTSADSGAEHNPPG